MPVSQGRTEAGDGPGGSFDWLEGATGLRVCLSVCDRLLTISVEGELDAASLDVLQSIVLQALDRPLARVELDLRAVTFLSREAVEMSARGVTRARERRSPFLVTPPHGTPLTSSPGLRDPR